MHEHRACITLRVSVPFNRRKRLPFVDHAHGAHPVLASKVYSRQVESHLFALGSRALVVQKETQNLFARATERRHATRIFESFSLTHTHTFT